MCPLPDTESLLGAFLGRPFSKDSFASKLSSPQPRDGGSLLTAGSETGALIQCLLNSAGLSRRQRMLDQGWRVWKTLTRYGVWSQEIKLVERGKGEKERKENVPAKIFLLCFTPTLRTTQNFSAFTTGCSGENENLPCHTKEQANNYFPCLNTYLLSFCGALSYQPLPCCTSKRTTWPSILATQIKPSHCPFLHTEKIPCHSHGT